jgi:hypothetical protein
MSRLTDEDMMDDARHGDPEYNRPGPLWHCNRRPTRNWADVWSKIKAKMDAAEAAERKKEEPS